jgi:hypothetical protein
MNDLIELARQAGFRVGPSRDGPDDVWGVGANLKRLAKLVAEKEREECAKLCETIGNTQANMNVAWRNGCRDAAIEIRARGQE